MAGGLTAACKGTLQGGCRRQNSPAYLGGCAGGTSCENKGRAATKNTTTQHERLHSGGVLMSASVAAKTGGTRRRQLGQYGMHVVVDVRLIGQAVRAVRPQPLPCSADPVKYVLQRRGADDGIAVTGPCGLQRAAADQVAVGKWALSKKNKGVPTLWLYLTFSLHRCHREASSVQREVNLQIH